jgi:hypothetical protein
MIRIPVLVAGLTILLFLFVTVSAAEVITSDTNKDGDPDAWTHVRDGNVIKQELDVNFDGKVDAMFIYEYTGKVKEETLDTDYDGRMDNWRVYEDGKLAIDRIDSNHDGRIDLWFYVDGGKIIRLEKDTTGDGKPDTVREY